VQELSVTSGRISFCHPSYPISLDGRIIRCTCSYEHETAAKPSPQTLAIACSSAATKATTQASAAIGTEFMAETPLRPLKEILETIREQADFALKQLQKPKEEYSMRWKCKDCNYIKHFTRPVPLEAAGQCPRCKSISFECLP
jgi:predicted Zn-ribbon and HTH transcriptional regulator